MASDIRRCSDCRCVHDDDGAVTTTKAQWKFVLVLVLLLAILPAAHTDSQSGPSPDFSKHTLVRPRVYHGRSKRQISTTKENEIDHADVLTVGFNVDGVERILDLRLNSELIPVGYQQRYQHQGSYKVDVPSKVELCHYQGSVRDVPGSWVALSTCRGLRGVIFDGENLHHIHPEEDSLESTHYLYKHRDLLANHTCGYEGTAAHHHLEEINKLHSSRAARHKRAAEVVRGPYNANRQSRFVELVFVIDKKEYIALDENLDKVYQHCKDMANIINALFMPLNIFVALIGVQVWTDTDEITLSPNGDTTLSNFLRYRREKLVQDMPNDNAQLLTGIQFEGGVVGKALKGPICTYEFSGGVSMDHSEVVGLVAATVAHEMGHNFGMEHDSADCACPEEKCIMAPAAGSSGPTHWSSCSLEHLALAFEHGMDYCLRNKPQKLFDSPMCGNGFVEPGEQCDCGLKEYCDNPCCNATTCMLHANASCATGVCCDLTTCRPKSAGTECRSAEHECDLPEYCTGQSEYCPGDVFKIDGESCNKDRAFCYQGSCRTHNDQCKLLWGPTGSSSDEQCYDMNNRGTKNGNCGYNRLDSSYIKCTDENLLCGMLHCKHLNERLEFGMESVAILSHSFINNGGKIIACRSAIVDFGLNQVDPGLAPDGAKCAPGKMCVNQKCVAVANLRASVSGGKACPNNCGGNGVCNSLGHCHCNRGFRPPDCTQPGVGGSEDSGPAEDPNARHDFITVLYIIFLGVVPMMGLSAFGVWYMRNSGQHWKKGVMSTSDRGRGGSSIKTIDRSSPMPRSIEPIESGLGQDPACASLLPKIEPDEHYNDNLFGRFKGFTITPIHADRPKEPTKPAPPPPTIPTVAIKTNVKPIQRSATLRTALNHTPQLRSAAEDAAANKAPTLPPLNPGCTARPLISSPVLAATTCTSLELIGPNLPTKPAPDVPLRPAPPPPTTTTVNPAKPQRPNSTPLSHMILPGQDKKPEKQGGTLNRIASMLRPNSGIARNGPFVSQKEEKSTNSLPRNQHHKANKVLDKEILRNLEISNPIPQREIEIPTPVIPAGETEKRNVVLRAQSMRDAKVTARPVIHTFGSMRRVPPVTRPTSIPVSARPTSPPPGPPVNTEKLPEGETKIPGLPGYQNPPVKATQPVVEDAYDDCMNLVNEPAAAALTKIMEESPSNDNIYAVIEDPIPEKNRKNPTIEANAYKSPKSIENTGSSNGAVESMGLLSEIVSEISNRNFDSIYSTSTLARKKREKEEAEKNAENSATENSIGAYINSTYYKSPGSVYSNTPSGKFTSAGSTTSSGYLNPAAVNVPQLSSTNSEKSAAEQEKNSVTGSKTNSSDGHGTGLKNLDVKSSKFDKKPLDFEAKATESTYEPFSSIRSRLATSLSANTKKDTKKEETGKAPEKPSFNRTKTPPHISKNSSSNSAAKTEAKQTSDATSKTAKQTPEVGSRSKQLSDGNPNTVRQNSDGSLRAKRLSNRTSISEKSSKESDANQNTVNLKSVPCSPKDSPGKLDSPDLVSSCSNGNQSGTKSPDVLGSTPKFGGASKTAQKAPTLPRGTTTTTTKAPTMAPKPLNITNKSASVNEKKKSPTGNVSVTKSLSSPVKENAAKFARTKPPPKTDGKSTDAGGKSSLVQRAASSKSNVASLQQKFEANEYSTPRSAVAANKRPIGKLTEVGNAKK